MADGDNWKVSGRGRGWLHSGEARKPLRRPHHRNEDPDSPSNSQPTPSSQPKPDTKKTNETVPVQGFASTAVSDIQPNNAPNFSSANLKTNSSAATNIPMNYFQSKETSATQINSPVRTGGGTSLSSPSKNDRASIGLHSALSPLAAPFVPRTLLKEEPLSELNTSPRTDEENIEDEPYIVQQVRNTVNILTVSPGKFDSLVPPLASEINLYVVDEFTLSFIAEILFEGAVNLPNFRYNAARVCNYFSKNVEIPAIKKSFRQIILTRCGREHKSRDELVKNDEGMERLRGFIFFMGELFVNMELVVSGISQKFAPVGFALIELLETITCHQNSDNIKCIGQLLKFAGAQLDDFEMGKTKSTPRMDNIFKSIKGFTLDENIQRAVREMLVRVVELRASDWGRSTSSPVVRSNPDICDFTTSAPMSPVTDTAVKYGPDGKPLTLEEVEFLEASGAAYEGEDDDDDDYDFQQQESEWAGGSEMDEEMEADFEAFLKESGQ